jgi:hypothetical protein
MKEPPRGLKPAPRAGWLYLHFNTGQTTKPAIWIRQQKDGSARWAKVSTGFTCPQDPQRHLEISKSGRPSWNKKPAKSRLTDAQEEEGDDLYDFN